jgi:hypothetical protein
MKIFNNIENEGYWIPGNTYSFEVWLPHWHVEREDTPNYVVDDEGAYLIDGGDSITATSAGGEYYYGVEPNYTSIGILFASKDASLDDCVGGELAGAELVSEGVKYNKWRFRVIVPEDAGFDVLYLKVGSYKSHSYLGVG